MGILAVAYSDIDGLDGYSTHDVLIAKLVDKDGNKVPSISDTVVMGRYPTDFTPSNFADWNVTTHVVGTVLAASTGYVHVRRTSTGEHIWKTDTTSEYYQETAGSASSAVQDGFDSTHPDYIHMDVGSPSHPDALDDQIDSGLLYDRHINVDFHY
jgi:hypothetical protein